MTDEEVLACPECDRTPLVTNAPGGRSHGDSEEYRCTRCGWKGDEPRRRERRGDPDLRADSLAAKLDDAESLDELVTDGGREHRPVVNPQSRYLLSATNATRIEPPNPSMSIEAGSIHDEIYWIGIKRSQSEGCVNR